MKIFSFPENIFTWKYFTLGKYFAFNQMQPKLINMQTRGSINKTPIKLSMQWKINWHDDLFTNGENQHGKNPTGWF